MVNKVSGCLNIILIDGEKSFALFLHYIIWCYTSLIIFRCFNIVYIGYKQSFRLFELYNLVFYKFDNFSLL